MSKDQRPNTNPTRQNPGNRILRKSRRQRPLLRHLRPRRKIHQAIFSGGNSTCKSYSFKTETNTSSLRPFYQSKSSTPSFIKIKSLSLYLMSTEYFNLIGYYLVVPIPIFPYLSTLDSHHPNPPILQTCLTLSSTNTFDHNDAPLNMSSKPDPETLTEGPKETPGLSTYLTPASQNPKEQICRQ